MSSQRDPRALEIRGAWLYSDRCSQQNHLKLSSPLCVAQWQRKVVYSIQLVRKEVMFFWYGLKKQKHKKPVAKITRNLIPSREWSFPKRWKVSKVGQKKLLFDLQWPGRIERRGRRRRRVTRLAPVQCVSTAHSSENQLHYTTNSRNHMLRK